MYRVRKDYDKKKWDEDRDRIIARYYYNKYNESITGLDNDFNKNLSVLEKFDMKTWNELDSIKTQDVYYNALKERQQEIKQQLLKHKSIYISGYGEENYNTMLKNVKRLGKKINRITGLLSETNDFYGQFLNEQEFNDYKQFNNMKEKYGDLSDYDSWVNASNTAVGDEKEWLEKYPIYYGYANQDFRDKYLEKLQKGIDNAKSSKEYGFTLREKITALQTEMMNAETEYWKYKSGSEERNKYAKIMEDAKKKLDEIYDQVGETIFNASTSDIYYYDDKIKNAENKKAEFESVVNYYSETLPFTKVTQNDDFKSVVRDIDTTDYLKKLKTDIVDGKSDTKAGKYLTDEMREEFKEYFDGMDISLLRESERQILVYNFEKMKDAVTAGGGYDKISDDDALTAGYHMGLNKSFLKLINENHYLEQREQQNEYEYYKNAPDWKQAIHSVLSVPANLEGSILSIPYTLGTGIAGGEINPYSNWYWLQNYASAVTGGVSADLEQKYGSAGPEIYGYGIAGLELLTEIFATRGLGKLASLPTKAMSYIQGSLTASRAFSGTVVDAKKRGLSDEQALLLGGISATAEFATEKIGFDRMMKSLGKKGIQKLTKSFVAKEIVINAVSEGAEELSSDVINWVADIIVSKDKSQWEQSIQSYIIEGDDYSTACNKAFKDAAWQMGSSFLGGFLIGGAFGGVSSAVNYNNIKNLGKNLVNNNQYDNVMNIAQQADDGSNSDILLKELSDGKISNAQLGQLAIENYKDNSDKIVQIKREIIENTIAQRYAEAGGNNDSSVDVIMKVLSGEKVNKTETDVIQNDDTAKQIFNEILKMDSWVVQAFEKANTATQDLQKNNSVLMGQAENINSNVSDGINEQNGFVENKIKTDNKLATIRSQAKSETALNDLTEHIDDTYYKVVYNETVNSEGSDNPSTAVSENTVSAKSDGNSISVEERSAEFNRIYDMGIDEDIPPHEITSDIFTPEQVRRIYAAAVVDDNIRNKYGNKVSFTELLKEYEDKARKNAKNNSKKTKQVKVDKPSGNQYNKKRGEENEKNTNSELLERRGVSAVSGNSNILRQQDNGTAKISRGLQGSTDVLEISRQSKTERSDWLGNNERKHAGRNRKQGQESRRFSKSSIGNLSRVTLNGKDTAGRILDKNVIKEFSDTVFKTQDGKLLSLYHWTDKNFKTFKYGDIGFHFGTYSAAEKRKSAIERERAVNESIYKEVYINIKNPVIINYDPMSWRVFSAAYKLAETEIISERDIKKLENLGGFYNGKYNSPASIEFRKILESKGYDGIIYSNDYEGDYSVIALSPGQIYTVSENDTDIKKAEDNSPAFSVDEKNNKTKQSGKNKKGSLAAVADEQASANTLKANSGTTTSDNILSKNSENVKENENNTLKKYSEHQIENWKNSKSIVVYENEQQLKDFVDEALNNKNLNKKMYFGIISDDTANIVLKKTGANIKNYNISLKGYEIKKILNNSHGNEIQESLRGQRAITFDDIKMIPEIISYPDEIMLDSKLYQGKPVLKFFKTINGKTTVVTYVSDKHKDLTVQTMYSGKNKKGNLATATDALPKSNPLSLTPETTVGTVTSDNIILNSDENVKNGEKNSENIQKSIKNQSSAEEWTADYKNENSEYKEAPAITEIVKTISEEFNIPISKGKYKGRALGIYKTQSKTARTRVTNALPTVLHEALGHHLDNKYHFTEKAENIEELISKIKELSPGWIEQYKKSEQPYEAFAEFLREYATDKTRAKVNFPNYFVEFEKTLKSANNDDFKKLQKVADMTNAYMASTRNERRKSAVITRAEAERRHKKAENLSTRFNKIRARIQDEAIALKPLGNAYSQYYSAKQADMRVYSTITGDYMTGIDGNYAYKTDDNGKYLRDKSGNKILQKSMANILSALPDGKADSDFTDYLVIKHAIEWINEDKRVYADDTLNDAEYLKHEVQKYEKKYPMYKQVSEELYEYQNELLKQWLVAGGLMTYDDVKELKQAYPCYVPFQRDVGDVKNINSKAKGSISNQNTGIKRAKGSGLDILSPIESIMINTEKYIKSAERNTVMREIADFVQKNPGFGYLLEEVEPDRSPNSIDAFPVKSQIMEILQSQNINSELYFDIDEALNKALGTSLTEWVVKDNQGRDIVYVSENGEKKFFQVHDKELLIALNGLNKPQLNGVVKFMSGASRVMKATTTGLNVFWSLRSNMLRDFDSAYKYSKEKNFAVFVKDYVTAMGNAITKSDKYKEYQAAGGGYSSIISNPKTLTSIMNKLYKTDKGKIRTFLQNKMQLIELIEGISDVIEAGPRFAEYERVLKETGNKRKAVLAADEITVNFKRKGSLTNTIEPFFSYFNAGVQGVSKVVTTLADKNTNKSFIVKSMVMAVISSALIFGWNRKFDDDDEYEKLSAYKRNNFYNFYVGNGEFISIPKSKDTAFLNSLFENIIYELTTDNHDFCENFKNFSSYVFDTFLPAGIPNPVEINSVFSIPEQILSDTTLFGSVAEAMSNQNYMGSPIVPPQYENLEPWAQYDENTTAIAKWLGSIFNFSPMKIDHIITSNTGMIGDLLKDLTADKKNFAFGFDSYISDSAYSNDIVNKFYDNFDSVEKRKNTAVKHNPDTAGKDYAVYSQYSMYKSIASVYNSYADSDEKNARKYKALRRDLLNDFNLNIAGNVDERLVKLYNSTKDSEIFLSKSFNDEVTVDGKKYKISLDNFIKFFDEYNKQIKEAYEPILSNGSLSDEQKAKQLKTTKTEIYNILAEYYAAQTNDFDSDIAKHKDSKLITSSELLRAMSIVKPAFADTDGNGYVSKAEKNAAINKAKFSSDIKSILRKMDII